MSEKISRSIFDEFMYQMDRKMFQDMIDLVSYTSKTKIVTKDDLFPETDLVVSDEEKEVASLIEYIEKKG